MIRVALYTRIFTGVQDVGNQQAQLIRFARSQNRFREGVKIEKDKIN
ncbi:MAG: hypothetical protein PHV34_19240 [Verrucomicrobiae bacterium]|nr:hypothetical protein [Verrucomicrobiae bacterium]